MSWPENIAAGDTYVLEYSTERNDKSFYVPEIVLPDYVTIELPPDWPRNSTGNLEPLGWSCKTLTFGTGCVIDLSPKDGVPPTPPKGRRGSNGVHRGDRGFDGEKGQNGTKGTTGVDLILIVSETITPQGSLFINIDGGPGGNGGDGGDGGNGAQGECTATVTDGFAGPNGGDGGNGGNAGIGGDGGDTAKVMFDIPTLPINQAPIAHCIVPDKDSEPRPTHPPQPENDGIVRIYGTPGRGGRGGTGGRGGVRGGGDNCGTGRTDRHEGNDGSPGRDATSGSAGEALCFRGQPGACRGPGVFPPKS